MGSRTPIVFTLLGGFAVAAICASLLLGSVPLSLTQVLDAMQGSGEAMPSTLIFELRLPRAITAFAVGGLLAVAGALMQVLLRNPLADPYVMGVSGGAAVGALGAILVGAASVTIDVAAATGAMAAMLLVFALAHGEGSWTPNRLLLTGVIVAAGCSALVSLMLALGQDSSIRGMLFWLMGDLAGSRRGPGLLALLVVSVTAALPLARYLNVLARGETQAWLVGLPVNVVRTAIFGATSIVTAVCVTTAGTIGFVGLVTPHLVRLMIGSDHRRVIPAAALLGGILLTCADLVARTAFAPRQLPVGALTALIGVPLFLALMRRSRVTV